MPQRLRALAGGLAVTVALGACSGASASGAGPLADPTQASPRSVRGTAWTFAVGSQRLAVAVIPPVSMVLVRTGPYTFWATPSYTPRFLYLEERVSGHPAGNEALIVNPDGAADYRYTLAWNP
jgi:hypothetical protein